MRMITTLLAVGWLVYGMQALTATQRSVVRIPTQFASK